MLTENAYDNQIGLVPAHHLPVISGFTMTLNPKPAEFPYCMDANWLWTAEITVEPLILVALNFGVQVH